MCARNVAVPLQARMIGPVITPAARAHHAPERQLFTKSLETVIRLSGYLDLTSPLITHQLRFMRYDVLHLMIPHLVHRQS